MPTEYAIEMKGITKTFGSVVANRDVELNVRQGEILALLGENGSGKTTLMNMLSGIYKPDSGTILVNGRQAVINSPEDAKRLGIGMVHQTAILCINDAVAQGAIRAIADKGLRVPEDISVVSCDQFPSGEYSCPRLTTLDQQNSYLGRMSIMTLIGAINQDSEGINISHEPRLIIRESCGARLDYRFQE